MKNKGQEVIKACAVRSNLTDLDLKFMEERIKSKKEELRKDCLGNNRHVSELKHNWELLYHTKKDRDYWCGIGTYKYKCKDCGKLSYSWRLK